MQTVDLNLEVSREIDARRRVLAEAVTARQYELRPDLAERYGERGRAHCLQDAEYHLSYLADAIATSSPALFFDYVGWAKVMLAARGVPEDDLATNLETVCATLRRELPGDLGGLACEYVEAGLRNLRDQPSDPPEIPELLRSDDPLYDLAQSYLGALLRGERHVASRLVLDSVEGGVPVRDLYLHVFQRSQHEVGRLWQTNRLSVAQEHYCTAATQLIMSQLYPYVFADGKKERSMVATCIGGDLHEIGLRMVSDFFQMEGWDTFYLGANVPAASLLKTLAERRADVLAISATMTAHVRPVAELIAAVRSQMGDRIKVLVGGYPFNVAPDLWRRVGADGNLIGNAVKFSPPGSAVDVRVTPGGERVTLAVEDRGPGIPAEERDKLFRPFARTRVRSTAGKGERVWGWPSSSASSKGMAARSASRVRQAGARRFSFRCPAGDWRANWGVDGQDPDRRRRAAPPPGLLAHPGLRGP